MKTTLVRLEAQDDYVSVRDKLAWIKTGRALLVWPRRNGPDFRPLDWQLIRHAARRRGIQLAVVARQAAVRREAERVGLAVFTRLADAQRAEWPRWQPLPRRARADLQGWREWARRPSPEPGLLVRLTAFLAALFAVFAWGAFFVPSAEVRLVFPARSDRVSISLPEAAERAALNPATVRVVVEGQRTAPVSGTVSAPMQAARGQVELTNVSAAALDVPRGTLLYALADPPVAFATLTFRRLEAGESQLVEVEAVEAGEAGNLPAGQEWVAEGGLGASLQVHNPQPLTGGAVQQQPGPSASDRQRLWQALQTELQSAAVDALQEQLSPGDALLPDTVQLADVYEQIVLPPEGEPGERMAAYGRLAFAAEYVAAEEIRALVETVYQPPPGFVPRWEEMRAQVSDGWLLVELPLRPAFAENDLARLARGRSPERAAARLSAALGLSQPVEIRLRPAFWPWLPWLPSAIDFVQQTE